MLDPERSKAIESDPSIRDVVMGDDISAFQDLLRASYKVRSHRLPKRP